MKTQEMEARVDAAILKKNITSIIIYTCASGCLFKAGGWWLVGGMLMFGWAQNIETRIRISDALRGLARKLRGEQP